MSDESYAVVRTGGKQYRVKPGDSICVEKLAGAAGADVALEEVLLVNTGGETTVGSPTVQGAKVTAKIMEQGQGCKVLVFKKRRRQGYKKKQGHRQQFTKISVESIVNG